MEVILQEKVNGLGDLGDVVTVKAGYGRNYLIPSGKAIPATKQNLELFEQRRAELEKEAAAKRAEAESKKEQLEALEAVVIAHRAGEEGKLFGSVGTADIARACTDLGIEIQKSQVRLPHGVIRSTGDFDIVLHLHPDVNAKILVRVIAEE